LRQASEAGCRHLVIIGGNHDSPSFLNAPAALLKSFNISVLGACTDNIHDEILLLRDVQGQPELLVCAVPFLRDRDVRRVEESESLEDKENKLTQGIRAHYNSVAQEALRLIKEQNLNIPLVGMGHLFTAGGQIQEGDGVRELYVGTLAHLSAHNLPDCFDYLALGHLHSPQSVGNNPFYRYSGAPLAMSFNEAGQKKSVVLVEFQSPSSVKNSIAPQTSTTAYTSFISRVQQSGVLDTGAESGAHSDNFVYPAGPAREDTGAPAREDMGAHRLPELVTKDVKSFSSPGLLAGYARQIKLIEVPEFIHLYTLRGHESDILRHLSTWVKEQKSGWVEIILDSGTATSGFMEALNTCIEGSLLEILRIKSKGFFSLIPGLQKETENLTDLTLEEMFERCLLAHKISPPECQELRDLFQEAVKGFESLDQGAF